MDNPREVKGSQLSLFWLRLGLAISLVAVLIWFYWPVLLKWAKVIYEDENYSFGLLIPLVIAYIIYRKWPELTRLTWSSSWLGLPCLVLAFVIYIYGTIVDLKFIQIVSLWVMLVGMLLLQGGWRLLRLLSFPLFLLLIMIPLPKTVINFFTFRLQLFSSWLSAEVLRVLGFTTHLQGNIIDLGGRQLQVAEACSGLGYIINALVLGIVFCYFFQRQAGKVVVLLLSLVPAAIVANVLRLVGIAYFPMLQEGFWHMSLGLSIFILGFDYLRLINWLLNRFFPTAGQPAAAVEAKPPGTAPASPRVSYYLLNVVGLIFLVLAYPLSLPITQPPPVPMLQSFDKFPMHIDGWVGKRYFIEDAHLIEYLAADDYLQAEFVNGQQDRIALWITYHANQVRGVNKYMHSPQYCMPGSGWKIIHTETVELGPGQTARYSIFEKGQAKQGILYWYLYGGKWLSTDYQLLRMYIGLDSLIQGKNYGSLIQVSALIAGNEEKVKNELIAFAALIKPLLPEFIRY